MADRGEGAAAAAPVWDPLVRLTHWTLAAAIVLNGMLVDDDSIVHVWIGYAAFGVLGLRLLWGLVGPWPARFAAFPPSLSAARAHAADVLAGRFAPQRSHNPLGALMVYAMWATLAAVCATGLMLESAPFWGEDAVEEAHEIAANLLLLMAAVHVAGVAVESRLSGVALIRGMLPYRRPGGRAR